jgi:DNA primase
LDYLKAKGIEPNAGGFINCLWHNDEHPSCKVNDEYVHCFACGESGDIFRVAAALIGVPCDREHFRQIASDIEKTLGLPEWQPPKQRWRPVIRRSQSAVYRSEVLKEFAKAIDSGDMEWAYYRASILFALYMLDEEEAV